jgi:ankyrin repeat protein
MKPLRLGKHVTLGLLGLVACLCLIGCYAYLSHRNAERTGLALAVQLGTVEEVKSYLDRGADPNMLYRPPVTTSPGLWNGIVRILSGRQRGENSLSLLALSINARSHRNEVVRLLLARGASPHEVSPGFSLVTQAAIFGDLETVRLLVEHGADVNRRGLRDMTPLQVAIWKHDREMFRYLLRHGATDPAIKLPGDFIPNPQRDPLGDEKFIYEMLSERHP